VSSGELLGEQRNRLHLHAVHLMVAHLEKSRQGRGASCQSLRSRAHSCRGFASAKSCAPASLRARSSLRTALRLRTAQCAVRSARRFVRSAPRTAHCFVRTDPRFRTPKIALRTPFSHCPRAVRGLTSHCPRALRSQSPRSANRPGRTGPECRRTAPEQCEIFPRSANALGWCVTLGWCVGPSY
jgi:hypothetical protein